MRFSKMNGIGNDYVYINLMEECIKNPSEAAKKLSDRNFYVGADGLVLIDKDEDADFCMRMFNQDGSEGEMCGNAIRCVGKYVFDKGYTDKREITVNTLAGKKTLQLDVKNGKVKTVSVNMGKPVVDSCLIPVISDETSVLNKPFVFDGKEVRVTCVSMGNPHAVIFIDDENTVDMAFAEKISNDGRFPKKTNVEFVQVLSRNELSVRVFERGTGETLACGTGACASFFAAYMLGYTESSAVVRLRGGELKTELIDGNIHMTGKAEFNYEGEIIYECEGGKD